MDKQNTKEIRQDLRRFREYMEETLVKVAHMEAILSISEEIKWNEGTTLSYEKYRDSRLKELKTNISASLSYLVDTLQPVQGEFEHVFEKITFKENMEEC